MTLALVTYDGPIGSLAPYQFCRSAELDSLNGAALLKKMIAEIQSKRINDGANQPLDYNQLYYRDRTFSIPIPNDFMPLAIFPQLKLSPDLFKQSSAIMERPQLFMTKKNSNNDINLTVKFYHVNGQVPPIVISFPAQAQEKATLESIFQPMIEQKTWRGIIEKLATHLGISANRISLYYSTQKGNEIIFPFKQCTSSLTRIIDTNSKKYCLEGELKFEILPKLYRNIDHWDLPIKSSFDDNEEERMNFFRSLDVPLMNQLSNFQKKFISSIQKDNLKDFIPILCNLIASEFHFNVDDEYLLIGLSHIISSTLLDIFLPYVSQITNTYTLYQHTSWKTFAASLPMLLVKSPEAQIKEDEIPLRAIIYFVVTLATFPSVIVNNVYTYLNHFLDDCSENTNQQFLGDAIFTTEVTLEKKKFVLVLTRGFVYLVNAIYNTNTQKIFPENLTLNLQTSDSYAFPVGDCVLLPFPETSRTTLFIGNKAAPLRLIFTRSDHLLNFLIFFSLAQVDINKSTIYPKVQNSSAKLIFLQDHIHAKVNVSKFSWDSNFTVNQVMDAFNRAGNFKILPTKDKQPIRFATPATSVNIFQPIDSQTLIDLLMFPSDLFRRSTNYAHSWSLSVLCDLIFNRNPRAAYCGCLLLKISDFSLSVSMDSPELLEIQVKYFKPFISNFLVDQTPLLHYASLVCTNSGVIRFLIDNLDYSKSDNEKYRRTALFYALRNPNISILQAFLDTEIDLDRPANLLPGEDPQSPLIYCLDKGHRDFQKARLLLRNGASVNNYQKSGYVSALEWAISHKDVESLTLIMPFCGKQVNAPNPQGQFVTHMCITNDFCEGLHIIESLDPDFNPNLYSDAFPHPLHYLIDNCTKSDKLNASMLALLRLKKIHVNALDADRNTPLICALQKNLSEIVVSLVNDPRLDIDKYGKDGRSALSLAVQKRSKELVRTLLKAGALANQPDQDGQTPLFLAVTGDKIDNEIARMIIENSSPYHWYHNNQLPIDVAPSNLKLDIEKRRPGTLKQNFK